MAEEYRIFHGKSPNPWSFRIVSFLLTLLGGVVGQSNPQDALCTSPLMRGGRIFFNGVREDLPVGATVGNLEVIGSRDQIALSYAEPRSRNLLFDPVSQNVTVTEPLDKESYDYIDIKVVCEMIASGFKVPIQVKVPILDVNDNPPNFTGTPYSVSVGELMPLGATVFSGIKATDADRDNWKITFEVIQDTPYADHFAFSSETDGNIILIKPLDYEETHSVTLHILAKDHHPNVQGQLSPQLTSTATLTINISDGDDQNPTFTKSSYLAYVTENAPIGTAIEVIPHLYAYDLDFGINASVIYSFIPDDIYIPPQSDYFEMDAVTGFITLKNDVIRRGQQFALLVKAVQVDNAKRYTTAMLFIKVQEANENQPRFIQKLYSTSLVENVPIGSYVTTVSALDNDVGTVLTYGFTRPEEVKDFAIDPKTGKITTARPLSYERQARYNVSLSVTDGQWFDYAVLIVDLINVNTHNPVFDRPVYRFQGHKEPEFFIGKVHATDLDIGSTVTYKFVQNTSLFTISPKGDIYLVGNLDNINDNDVISLFVSAEDDSSPPRKDAAVAVVTFGVGAAATMATQADLVIIIILAVLSGCLVLIIIVLSIYIYRNQHPPASNTPPYRTDAEPIDAYFETSKSFERGLNDVPTDYHNSYIDTSVGIYKHNPRDRHLAMYNDVGSGIDSTAIQENPFQGTVEATVASKSSSQTNVKSTPRGSKECKNSYTGYSSQNMTHPDHSRPASRSSHEASHSSRLHPQSSQSVARSDPHSSGHSVHRANRPTDYDTSVTPMDDDVYSSPSASDPSFRGSAGSLNMFKVGNSTQALVAPHSPAGSSVYKGKGSSVSFIDDHQVNVYHPDNAISQRNRDKPEITVYY